MNRTYIRIFWHPVSLNYMDPSLLSKCPIRHDTGVVVGAGMGVAVLQYIV